MSTKKDRKKFSPSLPLTGETSPHSGHQIFVTSSQNNRTLTFKDSFNAYMFWRSPNNVLCNFGTTQQTIEHDIIGNILKVAALLGVVYFTASSFTTGGHSPLSVAVLLASSFSYPLGANIQANCLKKIYNSLSISSANADYFSVPAVDSALCYLDSKKTGNGSNLTNRKALFLLKMQGIK